MKCKQCQSVFIATRNWQEFCRNECRINYNNGLKAKDGIHIKKCKGCGETFETKVSFKVFHSDECKRKYKLLNYEQGSRVKELNINPEEFGENLKLWRELMENWEKYTKQTHCAYCGKELHDGYLPFCNSHCQKHYIFDKKRAT